MAISKSTRNLIPSLELETMSKRFSKSFIYPTVWGFKEEMEMYSWIWATRPHVSFISGIPIVNPGPENFAHVLPKALDRYPLFRLNPDSVILVLYEEHFLIDQGNSRQRQEYAKRCPSADFTALELLVNKTMKLYEDFAREWK